jgi:hypothetical protein
MIKSVKQLFGVIISNDFVDWMEGNIQWEVEKECCRVTVLNWVFEMTFCAENS